MKKYLITVTLLFAFVLTGCANSDEATNDKIDQQEAKKAEELVEKLTPSTDENLVKQLEENKMVQKAEVTILEGMKMVLVNVDVKKDATKKEVQKFAQTYLEKFKSEYEGYSISIIATKNGEQILQEVFENEK